MRGQSLRKKKIELIIKERKLLELATRNSFENLAHAECVNAPIVGVLCVLLKLVSYRSLQNKLIIS